jgi:antitoxin component of MazEF toxin-antitoxin module
MVVRLWRTGHSVVVTVPVWYVKRGFFAAGDLVECKIAIDGSLVVRKVNFSGQAPSVDGGAQDE